MKKISQANQQCKKMTGDAFQIRRAFKTLDEPFNSSYLTHINKNDSYFYHITHIQGRQIRQYKFKKSRKDNLAKPQLKR